MTEVQDDGTAPDETYRRDPDYYDDGEADDDAGEPGWLAEMFADVTGAEPLSIAALAIAVASLTGVTAIAVGVNTLQFTHQDSATYLERAYAVGLGLVSLVALFLGLAALVRYYGRAAADAADTDADAGPRWPLALAGAAILVSVVALAFAIVVFVLAATTHPQAQLGLTSGAIAAPGLLPRRRR